MKKRKKNPRVYVVGTFFVLVVMAIWGKLVTVQVFSREEYREKARKQWETKVDVTATRGGIFDRAGRPLALSIRSCSVGIQPNDVKDGNKVATVLSRRLGVSRSAIRKRLKSKSYFYVKRQCTLSEETQTEIKKLRGVNIEWEASRVYPYGATAAKVVGFVGHDHVGMAGIEAAFDEHLRGEMGWKIVQRDGNYRSSGSHVYAEQKPRNGKHVVLTIDAALQELAEFELGRAIEKTRAKSGGVIVMDVESGAVLALAEYPSATSRESSSLVDSLWTIRSISHIYEPGSTFKLVTAGALLETDEVHSLDVFDAEDGKADMGVAIISDSHPYGNLTFREGFVFSSNIVMAKASLNLTDTEFYQFIRLFGFGSRTGIRLYGESPGQVKEVEEWSERTQITMAFGQEIAVTQLQLVNAFAAVANDGVLMVPRIVDSIVDENSGQVETFEPVTVRNVVSHSTAQKLQEYCRAVVEEGTGKQATLPYLELSGKTGTAQIASPNGGYLAGRYVASFVGFVPHGDPKIVCLISVNEPNHQNRFGGVAAAPVFARMSESIANSSYLFDEFLTKNTVDHSGQVGEYKSPNFLRLDRRTAMEMARTLSLNVLCKGDEGFVVAQDPDPGVPMARDDVIHLRLSTSVSDRAELATPDLRGLSMRMAKRRAIEAGFRCEVVGSGVVTSQQPAPGKVSGSAVVKIICKNKRAGRGRG